MNEKNQCPKCGSTHYVKHGQLRGRQRYWCKNCSYHFSVFKLGRSVEKIYVVRAIQLYLEGMGFRSIERYLGVSHVSVMNWVKQLGSAIELMRLEEKNVEIAEVDELCSFVGSKKTLYGSGLLLTGLEKKCWVLRSATEAKEPASYSIPICEGGE